MASPFESPPPLTFGTTMTFVSATASTTLFLSILSPARSPGACICRQPLSAPLHATVGPNSAPVLLESKAKGTKKGKLDPYH